MKMKNLMNRDLIWGISLLITFIGLLATSCSAQFWLPYTFFSPFGPSFFNPFVPFLPLMPPKIPVGEPVLTPYTAGLPTLGRFANATIIIILPQPTSTVTAFAPLGTVTLTPSVFVPLGLYLTLAE